MCIRDRLVGAVVLVVPCLFFGNDVMHLLYHQTSDYAIQVFGCLLLSFVATSSVYILSLIHISEPTRPY